MITPITLFHSQVTPTRSLAILLAGIWLLIVNKRGSKLASSICAPNATCTSSTLYCAALVFRERYRMNDSQILYATQCACFIYTVLRHLHEMCRYWTCDTNMMISAAVMQQMKNFVLHACTNFVKVQSGR